MTKLEMTIRQVSDLRDFYMKIKKNGKNHKAGNKALQSTSMYWDVKVVKPLPDHKLYIEIEDGRKGIFDMRPYLDLGVFNELKDINYFSRVGILYGAVTWPHDQEIVPETLINEMIPVE